MWNNYPPHPFSGFPYPVIYMPPPEGQNPYSNKRPRAFFRRGRGKGKMPSIEQLKKQYNDIGEWVKELEKAKKEANKPPEKKALNLIEIGGVLFMFGWLYILFRTVELVVLPAMMK